MKIYNNPLRLREDAEQLFAKFIDKDVWALCQIDGWKYWTKPMFISRQPVGEYTIVRVQYCRVICGFGGQIYLSNAVPEEVNICVGDVMAWYTKLVQPLEVISSTELFGEDADLWWEDIKYEDL